MLFVFDGKEASKLLCFIIEPHTLNAQIDKMYTQTLYQSCNVSKIDDIVQYLLKIFLKSSKYSEIIEYHGWALIWRRELARLNYNIRQYDKRFLNHNRPPESALAFGEWRV